MTLASPWRWRAQRVAGALKRDDAGPCSYVSMSSPSWVVRATTVPVRPAIAVDPASVVRGD
jgi:hypothetical protein